MLCVRCVLSSFIDERSCGRHLLTTLKWRVGKSSSEDAGFPRTNGKTDHELIRAQHLVAKRGCGGKTSCKNVRFANRTRVLRWIANVACVNRANSVTSADAYKSKQFVSQDARVLAIGRLAQLKTDWYRFAFREASHCFHQHAKRKGDFIVDARLHRFAGVWWDSRERRSLRYPSRPFNFHTCLVALNAVLLMFVGM